MNCNLSPASLSFKPVMTLAVGAVVVGWAVVAEWAVMMRRIHIFWMMAIGLWRNTPVKRLKICNLGIIGAVAVIYICLGN